jgi:hypothetical protein
MQEQSTACVSCESLKAEILRLRRRLATAQKTLSNRHKLRACREIVRTAEHDCSVSLDRRLRRALRPDGCYPLSAFAVGGLVLARCEYVRLEASFTRQESGCWLWIGAKGAGGYGAFFWDNKKWTAHRFTYAVFMGGIPFGMVVDHLCQNKACVNPAHLEPVTQGENIRRSRQGIGA